MKIGMPPSSGIIMPPVSPKEWNTGSTLNTLSLALASTRARAWAALARILRWDSTTPFGVPSEPDVNSTTAGSPALRATCGVLPAIRPRTLSAMPMEVRTSSR